MFTFALVQYKINKSIELHVKAFALNVVEFYARTFCFMLDTSNKNTLGAFSFCSEAPEKSVVQCRFT